MLVLSVFLATENVPDLNIHFFLYIKRFGIYFISIQIGLSTVQALHTASVAKIKKHNVHRKNRIMCWENYCAKGR